MASPRIWNCDRSTVKLRLASRASAPSGRLVKVALLTLPSTAKLISCGFSLRRTGKLVLTDSSLWPTALISVKSLPLPPRPKRDATRITSPTFPEKRRSVLPIAGLPPTTGMISTLPVDSSSPCTRPSVRMISPRLSAMLRRPSILVKAGSFELNSRCASRIVTVPSRREIRGRSPVKSLTTSSRISSTRP